MDKLLELHFYQEKDEPMIYIQYLDNNSSEHTLRIEYKHLKEEFPDLPNEIHQLADKILSSYEKL